MHTLAPHRQYARLPWLIVGMGVFTIVVVAVGLFYVENRLVASKGESLSITAAEIADKLELFLEERNSDLQIIAATPILQQDGAEPVKTAFLHEVRRIYPAYLWLGLTDRNGRIIVATDPATVGGDQSRTRWFQSARDGKAHISEVEPFEEVGGTDAFALTSPVRDSRREFVGAVSARLGIPAIEQLLMRTVETFRSREDYAGGIEYQFIDYRGHAFIDSDLFHKGNVNLKRLSLPSAFLSESGRPGYVEEMHKRRQVPVITGYAQTSIVVGDSNVMWTVLLRMNQADLLTPIRQVLWKLGASTLFIGGPLFIVLVWSTSRLKEEWLLAQEESVHARRAEASLRQSEGRFRELIELSQDAIYLLNEKGEFVATNPSGCRLFGYTEQELIGMSVVNTYLPEDRPSAARRLLQISHGGPLRFERVAVRKDGTTLPIDVAISPMNGGRYQAIVRDITARKRAEEALTRSRDYYLKLLNEFPALIWKSGVDAKCDYFNRDWLEFTGRTLEQELGDGWTEGVHPDDLDRCVATYLAAFRAHEPFGMEYRLRRHDGRYRWVVDFGRPYDDVYGQFAGYIGSAYDITERKRAEEALRTSEAFKNRILESSPDCIKVLDLEGRLLFMNKGGQELLEICDLTPFLNSQWTEFWKGTDKEMASAAVKAARAGNVGRFIGFCRTTTGKPKWWDVCITPLFDASGTPDRLLAISRDITERKRAEEMLLETQLRLNLAVTSSNTGLWDWDLLTKQAHYSSIWKRQLGYGDHEVTDRYEEWESRLHPDDRDRALAKVRDCQQNPGKRYEVEFRMRHKDGSYRWIFTQGAVLMDDAGKPCRMLGSHIDITERKRAEEGLKLFRTLLDNVKDSIEVIDPHTGRFLDGNEKAASNLGYTRTELLSLAVPDIDPLVTRSVFTKSVQRMRETGEPLILDSVHRRKDGTTFPVEVSAQLIRHGKEKEYIVAIVRDVTERRQTEEALRRNEETMRLFMEATTDCIWNWDLVTGHVTRNAGFEKLFGYAAEEIVPTTGWWTERLHPDDRKRVRATYEDAVASGRTACAYEYRFRRRDGSYAVISDCAFIVRDGTGTPVHALGAMTDITARKRAEEALRASEGALRVVLKEREQLMQDLHDGIIQSLYAIGISIEECRRLVEEDPQKARLKLGQEIADVNAVIREVRSHLVQGEDDRPFSANRFKSELTRIAGTMERTNALHFRLKVDPRAAECLTTEERREILYIAQEAMSNCLRHSGASIANVSLRLGRDRVSLEVEDDGTGFDKAVLHETNGGLHNIERRAAKVGAKMEIVSRLEHGTRIRLDVPIHAYPESHP